MDRRSLAGAPLSSVALVLLLACSGGSRNTDTFESGAGVEQPATSGFVGSSSDNTGSGNASSTGNGNASSTGGGVSAGNEGARTEAMGERVPTLVADMAGAAAAAAPDTASGSAGGDTASAPALGVLLWEQKRSQLLAIIERPKVAPDGTETALPDDDGLSVHDFSIATDEQTRINGTSFAPKLDGPLPAVIFLHGTGGARQDGFGLLRTLAKKGFFALAIDARYHGAGMGQDPYFNAIYAAYVTGQGHPFLYDTVWDVMRVLDYLEQRPDVDAQRIGLVGNSKGGMETYLATAVEPRIAVAVPWIALESFAWALDNNQWQARVGSIQGAFDQAAAHDGVPIDVGFVRQFYDRLVPGIYTDFDGPQVLPAIAPRPLLAVNGDSDPRTPRVGLAQCEAAATSAYAGNADHFELYIEPNTGHAVTAEATTHTVDWLVRWLM